MKRRESENFLNPTHGALFERLGLPDEKFQDLKALLVDFQMQVDEGYISLDNQLLSEEEKKKFSNSLKIKGTNLKNRRKIGEFP